jgi:MYXO-CTERM domain-containing protein
MKKTLQHATRCIVALSLGVACTLPAMAQSTTGSGTGSSTGTGTGLGTTSQTTTETRRDDPDYGWLGLLGLIGLAGLRGRKDDRTDVRHTTTGTTR